MSDTAVAGDDAAPLTSDGDARDLPETIAALAAFLDDLGRDGVRYCLWKSNIRLPEALAGRTDLDLLVDREHAPRFNEVVARHRLKRIDPAPGGAHPGMEHFLGMDRGSGRLFHLHVHYQLVLGERYVKNYRLPLEGAFLDTTRLLHGVPVPPADLEVAVLSVRALLKYRARDVVKDVLKIRSPGIPDEILTEIQWLLDQTTIAQVRDRLQRGDVLPADIVVSFLESITTRPRPGATLYRLRQQLRAALGEFQRHGRVQTLARYGQVAWRRRRRLRRRPFLAQMTPAGGGAAFALVGADGSGKSTLAATLAEWLSWKLEVRVLYMGSKAPSRLSRWLYLAFRAQRRGHRAVSRRLPVDAWPARAAAWTRDVTLALHHLAIARDRARRERDGRHEVLDGRVVVYDRFPLEMLSSRQDHRLLDGPQIGASLDGNRGRLVRTLAAAEERRYRRFRLPEDLVMLLVRPDVSTRRKPDHDPEVLAAKSRATAELATLAEYGGPPPRVTRIDANRPLDAVLLDVKTRLWDAL